jgi:hypothetical protein
MNHPGGPQSGMAEMESGLSLLGRLTERPALEHLLGATRGAPPSQLTAVVTRSSAGDSGAALAASFYLEVICNVILPTSHRGVQLFGCGAGLGSTLCSGSGSVGDEYGMFFGLPDPHSYPDPSINK